MRELITEKPRRIERPVDHPVEDTRLPEASDPTMIGTLALAVVLMAWTWSQLDGYQLADSVEYIHRARERVVDGVLDPGRAVRSFAFSLPFVPLFWISEALGIDEPGCILPVARLMQMALALLTVLATGRLAARVGGTTCGRWAAALLAINPVFLRYAVSPVAGIAAALCFALGVERLLDPGRGRRALRGGAWLGLAFMLSYKSLLAILLLGLLLLLRDGPRKPARWGGLGIGLVGALGVQLVLDWIAYGRLGASVLGYLVDNIGAVVVSALIRIQWVPGARDLARVLYQAQSDYRGYGFNRAEESWTLFLSQPPQWYLTELPQFLTWIGVAALALGLVAMVRRRRFDAWLVFLVVVGYLVVLSQKGDKSYRLVLPIASLFSTLVALGFSSLGESRLSGVLRRGVLRRGVPALAFVLCIPLGLVRLSQADLGRHGGYWRAGEFLDGVYPSSAEDSPRIGFAYPWAVFLRVGGGYSLDQSLVNLTTWADVRPRPEGEDPNEAFLKREAQEAEQRDEVRAWLDGLDGLVTHLPEISRSAALLDEVSRRFSIEAAFYDPETQSGLGPVYVLKRVVEEDSEGRRFVRTPSDSAGSSEPGPGSRIRFGFQDGTPAIELVDWSLEPLPGGWSWLRYRWRGLAEMELDYRIADRLKAPDSVHSFQNNHDPAYGSRPTSTWNVGDVFEEGYLVVPGEEPFRPGSGFRPLGGPYRRGQVIPVSLWLEWSVRDGDPDPSQRLVPLVEGAVASTFPPEVLWQRHGRQLSADSLWLIGRAWLGVHRDAWVPDDGRPVAEHD